MYWGYYDQKISSLNSPLIEDVAEAKAQELAERYPAVIYFEADLVMPE